LITSTSLTLLVLLGPPVLYRRFSQPREAAAT
jgi:hypothetical protein